MKKEKELMGKTEPRIFTPPLRKLTAKTSLGYACIEYAKVVLHKTLYPWQEWALIHLLEIVGDLEKEWHFRFRTVLLLVSRQNGKTVLSEVIASFFLNVLRVKNVLGTSLSVDKAIEVLHAVVADQEAIPVLAAEIKSVSHANGNNKMTLKGDRVYKIGAPNRRAGRGDSSDLVLLDEVREQRNWELWSAAVASTNARPNALVICFSNAGDPDSIVLRQVRAQGIAEIEKKEDEKKDFGGEDVDALGLFEWSAEDDADTNDKEQLAQANPALGYGQLTMRALMSNRNTFPENKFRSECMCQTVETILTEPFPRGAWDALLDVNSHFAPNAELYYGIDMSSDRRYINLSACGMREDGNWQIEHITKFYNAQLAIDWFRERAVKGNMNLAFQSRGAPISGLAEEICTIAGVTRFAIEGQNLTDGWNRFYDGIAAGQPKDERYKDDDYKKQQIDSNEVKIFHLAQDMLDRNAKIMQVKNFGNGTSLPDRVKSPDDISPLFSCIMAFSAATQIDKKDKKRECTYTEDYTFDFI